ncbi:hypothetical protein PanWU01x14_299920, partial [Parasponia andersonii]
HACCLICFIINDYAFKNLVSFPEILPDFHSHTTNPTKPTLGREQIRNTENLHQFLIPSLTISIKASCFLHFLPKAALAVIEHVKENIFSLRLMARDPLLE